MIKSITVTNHLNESLTINMGNPGNSGFSIINIDGLGPSKADIQMPEMALMHGAIYNSARVTSRNIVIQLGFYITTPRYINIDLEEPVSLSISGSDLAPYISQINPFITKELIEDLRQKAYKYFPISRRIELQIETDNRSCKTYGFVETNDPNIFSKEEGTTISIRCPDAFLYSTTVLETRFDAIGGNFEFPFSNESLTEPLLEFSILDAIPVKNIPYYGDFEVGMLFRFHATGNVERITISNVETNEQMILNTDRLLTIVQEGIHEGDDILISTVKGDKYVILQRDGVEYNILNCIEKYPSWFQLHRGDNLFSYNADVGETNLQLVIETRIAYEGI